MKELFIHHFSQIKTYIVEKIVSTASNVNLTINPNNKIFPAARLSRHGALLAGAVAPPARIG